MFFFKCKLTNERSRSARRSGFFREPRVGSGLVLTSKFKKRMKKFSLLLAFALICLSGYPCQQSYWNSCGPDSTNDMIIDAFANCCAGDFYIVDLCNNNQVLTVTVPQDGPNSSCIN